MRFCRNILGSRFTRDVPSFLLQVVVFKTEHLLLLGRYLLQVAAAVFAIVVLGR